MPKLSLQLPQAKVGPLAGDLNRAVEGHPSAVIHPAAVMKRTFDVAVAGTTLILLSVLLLIVASALLLMQGRPILIRHPRIGRHGATFPCFKFRTMVRDADGALSRYLASDPSAMLEWHANRKLRNDPRVTPLGKILRKTSLDELPQLINIIRGEMSIVGPRPIVAQEIPRYGSAIVDYQSVRPGLTGLWQCSGRNDTSYEQRVMLDKHYVHNWSMTQDFIIIVKTVRTVLSSRGCY